MSWAEDDRLCRELGIKRATKKLVREAGIFGSILLPRASRHSLTGDAASAPPPGASVHSSIHDAESPALMERGTEPKECPFVTDDARFGVGCYVKMASSTLNGIRSGTYGACGLIQSMVKHLDYRRAVAEDREWEHILECDPLHETAPAQCGLRLERHGRVSFRRLSRGRVVISHWSDAGKPIPASALGRGVMKIHTATYSGNDEVTDDECAVLSCGRYPRLLVDGNAAAEFERALRSTEQLIEFRVRPSDLRRTRRRRLREQAVQPLDTATTLQIWIQGKQRGRGRALWPAGGGMQCDEWCGWDTGDHLLGEEFRAILSRLNMDYGIPTTDGCGTLLAAGAWTLFSDERIRVEAARRSSNASGSLARQAHPSQRGSKTD